MDLRKHINFLLEKKGDSYEKGAVMLYFSFPELLSVHKLILPEDLYVQDDDRTYGVEDEPHTTLLYGVEEGVPLKDVEDITNNYTFYTCEIHNASLFTTNPDYDVLKYDVTGDNLQEVHQELQSLPYESDFPTFHPHLTIAYIKKGLGQKYAKIVDDNYPQFFLAPQYIIYSEPDGTQNKISIRVD